MRKLSLIGFAVALGAALIFSGCESPTNGSDGRSGPGFIAGSVSVAGLQAAVDYGLPLILADALIWDAGVVDFKSTDVTVAGKLETGSASIINAVGANFHFKEDAKIALATDSIFIGKADFKAYAVDNIGAGIVTPSPANMDFSDASGIAAIQDYTLSSFAGSIGANVKLYVYGNLTVTDGSVAPSGTVSAVNLVTLSTGSSADPLEAFTGTNAATLIDIHNATIKTETDVTVGLSNDLVTVKAVDASHALVLAGTIGGGATTFTVSDYFKNTGATTLSGTIVANFNGDTEFGGGYTGFTGSVTANFGGNAVFKSTAKFGTESNFNGNVSFGGATNYGGKVTLAAGKELTNNSTITLAPGFTFVVYTSGTGTLISLGTSGLVSGSTSIKGEWSAKGANGSISINNDGAGTNTTIAGSIAAGITLTAKDSSSGIVLAPGLGGTLTIGGGSITVALGGTTTTTAGGYINLSGTKAGNVQAGTFVLSGTDAVITTGNIRPAALVGSLGFAVTGSESIAVGGSLTGSLGVSATGGSYLVTLIGSLAPAYNAIHAGTETLIINSALVGTEASALGQ